MTDLMRSLPTTVFGCAFLLSICFLPAQDAISDDLESATVEFDRVWTTGGKLEEAVKIAEEIVQNGRENSDDEAVSRGLTRLAFAELHFGRWRNEWEDKLKEAERLARQLPAPNIALAEVLMFSGYLDVIYLQEPERGTKRLQDSFSVARAAQDDATLGRGYFFALRSFGILGRGALSADYGHRAILFSRQAKNPYIELLAIRILTPRQTPYQLANAPPHPLKERWDTLAKQCDLQVPSPFDPIPEDVLRNKLDHALSLLDEPIEGHVDELKAGLDAALWLLPYLKDEERWNEIEDIVESTLAITEKMDDRTTAFVLSHNLALVAITKNNPGEAMRLMQSLENAQMTGTLHQALSDQFFTLAKCAQSNGEIALANECLEKSFYHRRQLDLINQPQFAADVFFEEEMHARELLTTMARRDADHLRTQVVTISIVLAFVCAVALLYWRSSRNRNKQLSATVFDRTRSLEAAKDEAIAANRAKDEFLARINHEIRNPLQAIVMTSELIARETIDQGTRDTTGDILKTSAAHLVDIVDEVLDFTKIEAGALKLATNEFVLREAMNAVAQIVDRQCTSKVDFKLIVDSECPERIRTDQAKLRQCLINLGCNAAQHTTKGSVEIKCTFDPSSATLHVSVTDTGVGISNDRLESIFEIYNSDRKHKGTGLGLYISKSFVELMGGTLEVQSTEGEGTEFRLNLPVEVVTESSLAPLPNHLASSRLRVLVVDDEPFNLDAFCLAVESLKHTPIPASNWTDVERSLLNEPPDVVFMDLRMPDVDGFQMMAKIRQLYPNFTAPIYAVTGDATKSVKDRITQERFEGILTKPTVVADVADLLAAVPKAESHIVQDDS